MVSGAFLGEPRRKVETLERVRPLWNARAIIPSIYLKWSTQSPMTSLAGATAQTQDPEDFVATTGIPLEVALLCETLIHGGISFVDDAQSPLGFSMSSDDEIWRFGMEWLEAVPVGADLGDVVPCFLPLFLRSLVSDDGLSPVSVVPIVADAARSVLVLWKSESGGTEISAREWRVARSQATQAAERFPGPAAECVGSLCWPLASLAAEAPGIVQTFLNTTVQDLALRQLSAQDRADLRTVDMATPISGRNAATAVGSPYDPGLDGHSDQSLDAIALRRPMVLARLEEARRAARRHMTPFLRAAMDMLLERLRDAGRRGDASTPAR